MGSVTSSKGKSKRDSIMRAVLADNQADFAPWPKVRRSKPVQSKPHSHWRTTIITAALTVFSVSLANVVNQSNPAVFTQITFPALSNSNSAVHHSPLDNPTSPAESLNTWLDGSTHSIADLLGLEVQTIVIDAGHGGIDPGATGPGGLTEKSVTLGVAQRLRQRLEAYGRFRIVMTREDDDKYTLRRRVDIANREKADLFVSIHVNYLPQEPITFIETYYFGPQSDIATRDLAERENQSSSYSLSEFKPLIAKMGDTIKQQESRSLASSIQSALFQNMHEDNNKLINAGIKTGPFIVLLDTEMPSVLAELTCISNRQEELKLATPEYRDKIARYLEQGIVQYLSNRGSADQLMTGAQPNDKKETRAQGQPG